MDSREHISSGTLNTYDLHTYITKTGTEFKFGYHLKLEEYYEIDIIEMPSLEERSNSTHTTHRSHSPRANLFMIDVALGHFPKTLKLAKKISEEYANLIQTYISTGVDIDTQINNKNNLTTQ